MCAFAKIYNKAQHLTIIFYIMIPSSPLYQIGGKRVSFCVAFLMLLALFLIPVKTFARYEIIDEMRYNIIDDYAVLASNTDWKYGSHEKPCGLCVDFCQSEQEKLSIYDATQQSPELFHFCIKGFSRCICRPIDKVVKDFILSVIHSCRYIIEGFIPKFSYFAIP